MLAHLLTVVGEWAAIVGILRHAYRWGGSSAVGFVAPSRARADPGLRSASPRISPRAIASTVCVSPASRCRPWPWPGLPSLLRSTFLALQLPQSRGARARRDQHLRPTGAVLLPTIARSTEEPVGGNLAGVSHCDSAGD
ncbi:MAG: hypothetical protein IPL07_22440 [Acidimicrobiaceae bacterium]|nr:hypothetical protein [Acidimicrobiaceae bacterium]